MKKNKLLPTKKAQKVSTDEISPLRGYASFLRDLKTHIRSAQIKATFAVNSEMISLYWEIGKGIVERQENAGWGDEVLEKLSKDLRHEFPEMQGFSRANLYRMRAFLFGLCNAKRICRTACATNSLGTQLGHF
jgi:hypothetical protein